MSGGERHGRALPHPARHGGTAPPLDLTASVLHRDGLMLILDKPAGLPVHAGPGGGETLERHLDQLRFGLPRPPALAHRLDRDTSGCLVLGRHPRALRRLMRLFQEGRITKDYWAVVRGHPAADTGTIDLPLAKVSTRAGGWRMVPQPPGTAPPSHMVDPAKSALTDWQVLGRGHMPEVGPVAWVAARPVTGRTHQIRVHLEALGHPILGDPVYGRGPEEPAGAAERPPSRRSRPLHLHSRAVTVPLQDGKPPVTARANPPDQMVAALSACGWCADTPSDTPSDTASDSQRSTAPPADLDGPANTTAA